MAFDAASLLSDLFPGHRPARAPAEPEEARRAPPPAPSPPPPTRPACRLPGALPPPAPTVPEWVAMWKRSPQMVLPPKPCYWCGCSVFAKGIGGAFICANCHPVFFPEHVEMFVEVMPTGDGPQVVNLASCQVQGRIEACRRKRKPDCR
jgi:hypothetical protein